MTGAAAGVPGRESGRCLVIGGNGFLGSHVVAGLLDAGRDVRVMTRATSDRRSLHGLDVEHMTGDLFDIDALTAAMTGIDTVFHCAVDTRAWLQDPAPLYRTNVEGLRNVLDVAAAVGPSSFVFTGSMATIGRIPGRIVDEDTAFDWHDTATDYVLSRVAAERLALDYAAREVVPVVSMCVSNTYGAGDWQPTPHGALVAAAALGRLPFTVHGIRSEAVGVGDAAEALIRAADRGRPGQRYIVSERFIDLGEVISVAAHTAGRRPPRIVLNSTTLAGLGALGSAYSAVTGRTAKLGRTSVRLMHHMSAMSHQKAERELDWRPRPVTDAVAEGARFWQERQRRRSASSANV